MAPPINRISDASAFLWRLSLSQSVPAQMWHELAAYAAETFPGPAPHFIEWHIAMPLAALRDEARLEARLAALPAGGTLEAVMRGPVSGDFASLGGSGAQRRILHDTLAAAMMFLPSTGRRT